MRLRLLPSIAAGAACALIVAGCAAPQVQPVSLSGTAPRSLHQRGDLLYVSDQNTATVYVYSYPQGRRTGTLSGITFPEGLCVDPSGNVYVTDNGNYAIDEYAHGGIAPIKVLKDREDPVSCAVDSTTGNLAVANEMGTVSIYPNASGEPTIYQVPLIPWFCAYDTAGNLFADSSGAPHVRIAELPKGGSSFETVTYDKRNNGEPAGLQFVGNHLAVGVASPYEQSCCGKVYRLRLHGAHGRTVGRSLLRGAMTNFFIEGTTIVTVSGNQRIKFCTFPSGGHATKVINDPGGDAYGVVVSPGR
jgi:NHL repeat